MKCYAYRLPVSASGPISLLILLGLLQGPVCPAQTVGARRLIAFGPAAGLTDDTLFLDIGQAIAVQLLPFIN